MSVGPGSYHLEIARIIGEIKTAGFNVSTDNFVEVEYLIGKFHPKNNQEIAALLAPVFVTSEYEQQIFHDIFLTSDTIDVQLDEGAGEKSTLQSKIIWAIVAILIIVLFAGDFIKSQFFTTPSNPAEIDIGLVSVPSIDKVAFVNHELIFKPDVTSGGLIRNKAYNFIPRWSNSSQVLTSGEASDSIYKFIPQKTGDTRITLEVYKAQKKAGSESLNFYVCPDTLVNVEVRKATEATSYLLKAYLVSRPDVQGSWYLNDSLIELNSNTAKVNIRARQSNSVEYLGNADTSAFIYEPDPLDSRIEYRVNADTSCTCCLVNKRISIGFAQLTVNKLAPISSERLNPLLLWLVVLLMLVTGIFASAFGRKFLRLHRRSVKDSSASDEESSEGILPPEDIPLENNDLSYIRKTLTFKELSDYLRRPSYTDLLKFNLAKSIRATIEFFDFSTVVFDHKEFKEIYVFLIDDGFSNGQQAYLFDYLFRALYSDGVAIERFFFRGSFSVLYNPAHPEGLDVSALKDMFPDSPLVIFTDGESLLYPSYPKIKDEVVRDLGKWDKRVLVSSLDPEEWGYQEEVLKTFFLLTPARVESLLSLAKKLNEDLPTLVKTNKASLSSDLHPVDFESIDGIRSYLKDESMFQWLSSISIYATIRWEIIIEFGRIVLFHLKCEEKLNYNNVLMLAQIPWISRGIFPDDIRLELLKTLDRDIEILVRTRFMEMLGDSEKLFGSNFYFFEEDRLYQKLTNAFLIHESLPDNDRKGNLEVLREQYILLASEGNIPDVVAQFYLDNADRGGWITTLPLLPGSSQGSSMSQKKVFENFFELKKRTDRLPFGVNGRAFVDRIKRFSVMLIPLTVAFSEAVIAPRIDVSLIPSFLKVSIESTEIQFSIEIEKNNCYWPQIATGSMTVRDSVGRLGKTILLGFYREGGRQFWYDSLSTAALRSNTHIPYSDLVNKTITVKVGEYQDSVYMTSPSNLRFKFSGCPDNKSK